jgi:hypothetical protein
LVFAAGVESALVFARFSSQWRIGGPTDHPAEPHVAFVLNHDNLQESPVETSCPGMKDGRLMVALLIGQSNAANYGQTRSEAPSEVVNFYRGKCYIARDPLLGAGGRGGSVWTRMASKLIADQTFDRIVLAPVAITSSTVDDWTPGGALYPRIETALASLATSELNVTHVIWDQGESDAARDTPGEIYRSQLQELVSLLRSKTAAQIFVSEATICNNAPNAAVRRAQISVLDDSAQIFRGVDTDQFGPEWRYAGCHFSARGLERVGALWAAIVIERRGHPMSQITAP